MGLSGRLKHLPAMLSGGERQRVAVARALANEPAIVLADEPTGELDSASSREIIALMHSLNHRLGTTFIVVSHDPAVARQTDCILVLDSGRIVREDIVADPYIEDLKILKDSPWGEPFWRARRRIWSSRSWSSIGMASRRRRGAS